MQRATSWQRAMRTGWRWRWWCAHGKCLAADVMAQKRASSPVLQLRFVSGIQLGVEASGSGGGTDGASTIACRIRASLGVVVDMIMKDFGTVEEGPLYIGSKCFGVAAQSDVQYGGGQRTTCADAGRATCSRCARGGGKGGARSGRVGLISHRLALHHYGGRTSRMRS